MRQEIPGSFEIIVRKEKDTFRATCSMFPEISGEGLNEDKAIESLADGLADKMGGLVKTVLHEVFKGDFQELLKTKASICAQQMQNAAEIKELPRFADLPTIDCLLRGKNIDFAKRRPALHGTVMMMDMRPAQFCCPMPHEEYLYEAVRQSGIFNVPIPSECETPYGILLGVPLTYN